MIKWAEVRGRKMYLTLRPLPRHRQALREHPSQGCVPGKSLGKLRHSRCLVSGWCVFSSSCWCMFGDVYVGVTVCLWSVVFYLCFVFDKKLLLFDIPDAWGVRDIWIIYLYCYHFLKDIYVWVLCSWYGCSENFLCFFPIAWWVVCFFIL